MELEPLDIERFARAVEGFQSFIDQLQEKPSTSNSSIIQINAGGLGIWLSVTCCCVCFAITMACVGLSVYNMYKTDRMSDYLQAIYLQAPQLRPKE